MHITYRGGAQGIAMLSDRLTAEGVQYDYEPPMEERGAGQAALETTFWILQQGAGGLIGGAAVAGVMRAVNAVKAKWPRLEIEVKDLPPTDDERDSS